jgi:hypothetical protein
MADQDLKTKLSTIREIDFTALDYSTIQRELIEYISVAQTSQGVNDQFLEGDAAKLMIDLFSYLGELLSFRIDTLSQEVYLSTANNRQSIINLLELVAQQPLNPQAAALTVLAVPNTLSNTAITIPARFAIPAVGLDGNEVTFEIMNEENDYFTPIEIPANVTNYNVSTWSGDYRSYDIVSTGEPSISITLPEFPVINDSIKVSVTPVAISDLTPEVITSSRIVNVDSLIDSIDDMIYTVKYDQDGRAILNFATDQFGKIPPNGYTIHVDYRTGGGANTNISTGVIQSSSSFNNTGGDSITVAFSNDDTFAAGGADQDSLDTIKLKTPALVRANDNLVTDADYEAIIGNVGGVQDVFAVDKYNDRTLYGERWGVPSNSIFIWVLPESGGEISPDLRQAIATELNERRLTAIENFVFNPLYNNWELNATITLIDTAVASEVRPLIEQALLEMYGADKAEFKTSVSFSKVVSTIQGVTGVADVDMITPTETIYSGENEALRLLPSNIILNFNQ